MAEWINQQPLALPLAFALCIAVGAPIVRGLRSRPSAAKMSWLDWCGYYGAAGIAILCLSTVIDWRPLTLTGLLLLTPLYPIAILGLLGKLDELRTSLLRARRRR